MGNSSGVCSSGGTNGSTIDIEGSGTCTVQADQAGNDTYAAAPSVDQSFSVTAAVAPLSVSNIPGTGAALVGESFVPNFSYDGNGTTSVTSASPTICTGTEGNTVYFLAAGTCKLTAQATATGQYQAATGSAQTFTVSSPAAAKCTKSWAKAVNGNWSDASDWSPAGVPTSSDNVCIAVSTASYTVTVDSSFSVNALSVGGTAKTEALDIPAGSSIYASGNASIGSHGAVSMETDGNDSSLELSGGVVTNAGSVTIGSGGGVANFSDGSIENTGSISINGTLYDPDLFVVNGSGGSITESTAGQLEVGAFVQAGGTNTGNPITPTTLVLAGGGAASFLASDGTTTVQGGPLEAGQSIDVTYDGTLSLGNDLTSAGTISMETSTPYDTYLDLNGHTLTNTGTFDVNAGSNAASFDDTGTFDNAGTVNVAGTLYDEVSSFTNSAGGSIAVTGTLYGGSTSFTNSTGGSIAVTGSGSFADGTYTQAGGTNTGNPMTPTTLVLAGGGAASFLASDGTTTVQGGPLEAGQSIDVTYDGTLLLGNDLTSAGTISMETSTPYDTYLDLNGHTLTNTGTFDVNAGSDAASFDDTGTFDNAGTVQRRRDPLRRSVLVHQLHRRLDRCHAEPSMAARLVHQLHRRLDRCHRSRFLRRWDLHPGRRHEHGHSHHPHHPGAGRRWRSLLLGERRTTTVQGGPLEAGQSIDVTYDGTLLLGNDLTSAGTISMETSTPYDTYLDLNGHTLTNTGTFDVNAGSRRCLVRRHRHLRQRRHRRHRLDHGESPSVRNRSVDSFTNSTGGSIAVTGAGSFVNGTYTQAGGTNTGNPMTPTTLVLAGGGAASFLAATAPRRCRAVRSRRARASTSPTTARSCWATT